MANVLFADVDVMFSRVWYSGHEEYWYQRTWNILGKHGLTYYSTQKDYYKVFIRAITLSMLYEEFCHLAFDEYCSYGTYGDAVDGIIPEIMIGQLYGELPGYDFTDDTNYAICMLADAERQQVFKALLSEMTETDMFVGLYCTAVTPYRDGEEEETYDVDNYDEYWKMVDEVYEQIIDGAPYEAGAAFEWLMDGTHTIGWFHNDTSY